MYNLPEKYNARNYKKAVNEVVVDRLINRLTTKPQLMDPLFVELVESIFDDVNIPTTPEEGVRLYKKTIR